MLVIRCCGQFGASGLCTPLARGDEYDRAILESSAVGTPVMTISATDADAGPNAATRYRLEEDGGDSATFAIDAVSGVQGNFDIIFGPSFRDIWALDHPTHAVFCALLGGHAYIGC